MNPTNQETIIPLKKKAIPLSCLQRVVPPELERAFTPLEVKNLRDTFGLFDTSGDGSIDKWELAKVLIALGQNPTEQDLDEMINQVDENNDGEIQFGEFCHMMYNSKFSKNQGAFVATVKKASKVLINREEITTLRYGDGSVYQGQASKFGVFEGHGTYEAGKDGDTYSGQFKNGRFDGDGHIWYSDNSVFDGEFRDGMKNGTGTMRFNDGSTYIGSLKMGLFEGYGEFACCSGDLFKGHFVGGKKEGAGKMIFRDGAVFQGHWKNDQRAAGKGIMVWANKDVYEGEFSVWGLYHGTGKLKRGDTGDIYEGGFKDGRKSGVGEMIFANGDRYSGDWLMGTKTGQGTYWFADGNEYKGDWANDRMEGIGKYLFSSGDVYEGEFQMDHPRGSGKATYINGSVYEGCFEAGVPCGRGTMTSRVNGENVKWSGLWKHGRRVVGSETNPRSSVEEEWGSEDEETSSSS